MGREGREGQKPHKEDNIYSGKTNKQTDVTGYRRRAGASSGTHFAAVMGGTDDNGLW